jgi:hypothetical protein
MKYFLRRGTSVKGPYEVAKIRALLDAAKVKPADHVSESKNGPWKSIDTLPTFDADLSAFASDSSASSTSKPYSDDEYEDLLEDDDMADMVEYLPPQSAPTQSRRKRQKRNSDYDTSRYPSLKWFQTLHRVLGWITLISAVVGVGIGSSVSIMGLVNKDPLLAVNGGVAVLTCLILGPLWSIYIWAIADGIQLAMDVESSVRSNRN